jgi:3',5'-cyclic AMP phosphodiesterase CpdA
MLQRFRLTCLVFLLLGAAFSAGGDPICARSETKLQGSDTASGDWFGRWISVDGDAAIAGATNHVHADIGGGAAYVLRRAGSQWAEEAELLASDAEAGDFFGVSVGVSGNVAIVGASREDTQGDLAGAAYIYRFDGAAWNETKLLASDGAAQDQFGYSSDIDGDQAVVGAFGDDDLGSESGSAYVFRFDGASWIEEAKLYAADGAEVCWFGSSVAISGDVIIVGRSPHEGTPDAGAAYVFRRGISGWALEQVLIGSDSSVGDHFGYSVALSGDVACVGAMLARNGDMQTGAAYVFRYGGSTWHEEAKLLAHDGDGDDRFGYDVALSSDLAVVGAWHDEDLGDLAGSAYVFRNVGTTWVETRKLLASDGSAQDRFGIAVAAGDRMALIGAPADDGQGEESGSLYIYADLFAGDPFFFVHLTDPHIDASPQAHGASERLNQVLDHLRTLDPAPAFVAVTGDLVEAGDSQLGASYDSLRACFFPGSGLLYLDQALAIPVYLCPGNHDYRWSQNLFAYDTKLGYPNDNDHCYAAFAGGVQLLSVDSGRDDALSTVGDPLLPEATGLSQGNLDWLDANLTAPEPSILVMHHPAMNNHQGVWGDGCLSENRSAFLTQCELRTAGLVLCGHTHAGRAYAYEDGGESDVSGCFDNNPGEPHYYVTYCGPDHYTRTLDVQTPDTRDHLAYRSVAVAGDLLQVHAYTYAEATSGGLLVWQTGPTRDGDQGVRTELARLHVYDGEEHHLGLDALGALQFEIPGGCYAPRFDPQGEVCGDRGTRAGHARLRLDP